MRISNIAQVCRRALKWTEYDLILAASGFELRSRAGVERLPVGLERRVRCLGFPDQLGVLSRRGNDAAYALRGITPLVFSSNAEYETQLRLELELAVSRVEPMGTMRIYIDYSVMTRSWYGYVLSWIKYAGAAVNVEIDLEYFYGSYLSAFEPLQIKEVTAVPGFEGSIANARRTIAIFGLGFERYATLAVYEQVEPDVVVCLVAQDSPTDANTTKVLEANREILQLSSVHPVFLPLGDVQTALWLLSEEIAGYSADDEILAIPMGPKPHVLATMLLAQLRNNVTCLYAKGSRSSPVEVLAKGDSSVTRINYKQNFL